MGVRVDNLPVKQAKATARFYGFEKVLETMPGFANLMKRRPLSELQLFAGLVWAKESGRGKCPVVRLKKAQDELKSWSMYDYNTRTIFLLRMHHNVYSLLHELAHALGSHDKLTHGPAFRKRCVRLYREYGEWDGRVTWEKR